jgi:hypothetical protein
MFLILFIAVIVDEGMREVQRDGSPVCRAGSLGDKRQRKIVASERMTRTVLDSGTITFMRRRHQRTLELILSRPTSANIQWRDIESLFTELGAEVSEREGSRVAVFLFDEVRVFHRPHPSPDPDKGAVASVRKWLEQYGVEP